ncbi:MAG: metallophosphoesterase [Planctomycetia bacterium]|nr:metallophosphoesterase [Planctomycetia bacterium]
MKGKLWVIGDIHGYSLALERLLDNIVPGTDDTVVILGDYIDRGPDSRGVIQRLFRLQRECHMVPLLGNHEEMMLQTLSAEFCRNHHLGIWLADDLMKKSAWTRVSEMFGGDKHQQIKKMWLSVGGRQTLMSYGVSDASEIILQHLQFLAECKVYYETEHAIFAHAGYVYDRPMSQQPREPILKTRLSKYVPQPHISGKKVYVGHSAQRSGEILDLGHILCLDTCLYGGGWLTALEVQSGEIFQVDAGGMLKKSSI